MVKENIVNKWQEIDFETFKKKIDKLDYKNIYLDIKSMITMTLTIENYQLIINKLHLIISNDKELEMHIDIDPKPAILVRNERTFKLDFNYDNEILLDFYN